MKDNLDVEKEERQSKFLNRFGEDNPYALDLLKGHLLVEEALEEIILSVCQDPVPAFEARMSFFTKLKLAQAIDGLTSPIWSRIEKLNLARNELAHGRDLSILEKKIDSFVSCTRREHPEIAWGNERSYDLAIAIGVVHGGISRIAAGRLHV